MWEKMLRKSPSLEYRKRFKCPRCAEYTLLLIHDDMCECANGCDTDNITATEIEKIKKENDFNGYYTQQDINDLFATDYEMIEETCQQILIKPVTFIVKNRENEKIIDLFFRTDEIDRMLDDVAVKYMNHYEINELKDFQPYNYLFTLVEDMHYYLNLTCKDIYLFDLSVSDELPHKEYMYSGRFFGNNAIDHLFQAYERMYVILGLINGFAFSNDLSKNRTHRIHDYLKKQENYKLKFKDDIEKLKSNKFFADLKEIRNYNEHNLSYLSKEVKEGKFSDLDGNVVDKEFYVPIVKNIVSCLQTIYEILYNIVDEIDNISLYTINTFPMYEHVIKGDTQLGSETFNFKYYEKLDNYNNKIIQNIFDFCDNMTIADVYFRLDEVLHCIRDIYNHYNNHKEISMVDFGDFIGIDYFVYSAITRLYSCYDKIAVYIKERYKEYAGISYFDDCSKIDSASTIGRNINDILQNNDYKILQKTRNLIYHNLRIGIAFGEDAKGYYLNYMAQIVLKNELLLFEFLNKIKPIKNGKIERNAPCPCGSGKKYKQCHGKARLKQDEG